jgi:NAD(P)-dependent dehydrogenase (short-subunit alcohol dehydrogenase family)
LGAARPVWRFDMTSLDAFSLAGKVAIVTGAGSGIGRAIALTFADAGAAVACADIDAAAAKTTCEAIAAARGRALPLVCDVSHEADTIAAAKAVVEAYGAVHVLVNAAAATDPNGTVLDLTRTDWDRVFAVNVTGAFLMSRAVLPAMIAAGGSIIHIASQLGRVGGPNRAVYCATKGALIQLAKAMAIDHAAQNVRVNALSPGAVETNRLVFRYGDMEKARQIGGPKHLVMRLGQPDEIARAALFLASDASSFVTGSDLLVDGGYTAT